MRVLQPDVLPCAQDLPAVLDLEMSLRQLANERAALAAHALSHAHALAGLRGQTGQTMDRQPDPFEGMRRVPAHLYTMGPVA